MARRPERYEQFTVFGTRVWANWKFHDICVAYDKDGRCLVAAWTADELGLPGIMDNGMHVKGKRVCSIMAGWAAYRELNKQAELWVHKKKLGQDD